MNKLKEISLTLFANKYLFGSVQTFFHKMFSHWSIPFWNMSGNTIIKKNKVIFQSRFKTYPTYVPVNCVWERHFRTSQNTVIALK